MGTKPRAGPEGRICSVFVPLWVREMDVRKPETIEKLYLDFDGFFASVMQQIYPKLRGRPVGVIPMDLKGRDADRTCVIACSREAKAMGVKNIMPVPEARALCPDILLVTQKPDWFARASTALVNEIGCEIPIEVRKSVDEVTCSLDTRDSTEPRGLARRIKERIARNIGVHITCSIGFAPNRLLAKMACKVDKPNGVTIWQPEALRQVLSVRPLSDVPGIGSRMEERLAVAGVINMEALWSSQPKQLRALWRSVTGERMWYALHGYAIHSQPTQRGQFGHGRVLAPDQRRLPSARECSRLLICKAARRMRREGFRSSRLTLWLSLRDDPWSASYDLPAVKDDQAILHALDALWSRAKYELKASERIFVVGAYLGDLSTGWARQGDLLLDDDRSRQRAETITDTIDGLNTKFGKRIVTIGPWPTLDMAGGKIAYNQIPSAEDFW